MKICFYFPALKNDQNNAVFGSMYSSFFEQLEAKGMQVKFTTEIEGIEGDILVVSIGNSGEKSASKAMHYFKGPVILNIYNSYICFYKSFLKRWKSRFLFAYNPDYATLNYQKYNSVDIPYYHLPFGSDTNIFHPLNIEKKYDIAFLGNASSGTGRDIYIKKLVDYAKMNSLQVFLAGSGWEKFGYPKRIVKHGEETNRIYNASKICINIHNNRQYAGLDKEMDANNRLFDLAMAGCCQISNGEQMIKKYFTPNEVATADDPDEWIKKIDYYLHRETERKTLAQNARTRALSEHTWDKRAEDFIRFINETYPDYAARNQKTSWFTSLLRYLDQYMFPAYQWKEIKIIRYFLKKTRFYTR